MKNNNFYYIQNPNINRLCNIYNGMIYRCYNKKHPSYKYYGGRGIKVCEEWVNDFNKFVDWALDNGYTNQYNTKRKLLLSIDRLDSNKDYCAENCQWITIEENTRKARSGVSFSEEHKRKISEAHRGKIHSKESVEKMAKGHRKKVICITTEEVFESLTAANQKYKINAVCQCCKGKYKSAGKLPDGTKLKWQYYDDYLKNKVT